MQIPDAPLFRLIPRDVTVICDSESIRLNFAQWSRAGRRVAHMELPYELKAETQRERLNHFRFRVARLRFEASRS